MIKLKSSQDEGPSSDAVEKATHYTKFKKYYKSGVLDYETHNRLVMNIEFYAATANCPVHFLYSPAKGILTEYDEAYLENWFTYGDETLTSGALFSGDKDHTMMERMYAITGVLLRNFIDAKVVMIQDVVESVKVQDPVDNDTVLIPNFCLGKENGGGIATWEANHIIGWLLNRNGAGKQTIVYADSLSDIRSVYGSVIEGMINDHYFELN